MSLSRHEGRAVLLAGDNGYTANTHNDSATPQPRAFTIPHTLAIKDGKVAAPPTFLGLCLTFRSPVATGRFIASHRRETGVLAKDADML